MKKRIAIYARVSTDKQDYQRQIDELKDYSARNAWDIKYIFEEKMSGAIDERMEFTKMTMLDKTDIDIVLVWELSRLGRKMSTVIKVVEDFAKKNISVIALKERFQSLDDDCNMTPSTLMMLSFGSAMAQIERTSIKERMRSGMKHKLLSGEVGYANIPAFGYKKIDKKIVIDDKMADQVKTIFSIYKNGISIKDIAETLHMNKSTIYSILTNEAYTGKKYSKITESYLETPAIIDKADFDKIQTMLHGNRKITRKSINDSPLKRKLFCSECGRMMSKHGGEKKPAWQCVKGCNTIHFRYATGATETALQAYKNTMGYESTKDKLKSHIEEMEDQYMDMSKYVDNLHDKIISEKKKLEVLKDVFSIEQLKKEINSIKMLEKEFDKQGQILHNMIGETVRERMSLNNDDVNESIIDKIIVRKIDKHTKMLDFHIYNNVYSIMVDFKNFNKPKYIVIE